MKIQIHNKWQFGLSITRDYLRIPAHGWKVFTFGIFKFHKFPEEGGAYSSKDYKGFIIRFMFWLPFDKY